MIPGSLLSEEDLSDSVRCDFCAAEYRGNPASGGFLFLSKAACPACAPALLVQVETHHEQQLIRGRCPAGLSFHAWVMQLRGGDNTVRVYDLTLDGGAP